MINFWLLFCAQRLLNLAAVTEMLHIRLLNSRARARSVMRSNKLKQKKNSREKRQRSTFLVMNRTARALNLAQSCVFVGQCVPPPAAFDRVFVLDRIYLSLTPCLQSFVSLSSSTFRFSLSCGRN